MEPPITVANGIEEFTTDEWSAISAGASLYAGMPWHRFLEADPSYDVWYVRARSPDGSLLGVLPVHLHAGGPGGGVDRFYQPRRLFGEPVEEERAPSLLIGGRAGYETPLMLRPGLEATERAAVLAGLVGRARELARAWGADGLAGLYLTPSATKELAGSFGEEPLLTDVGASIDLHGVATMDGYLATLSSHRRRRVARELRDFRGGGYRLRTGRLSDWLEPAAQLLAQLHGRYGHADTPELLAFHLAQQAEHLDDHSRMLVCERHGRPVAFLLAYEWERVWYARAAGVADGMRGESAVFFNVVYYAAIQEALDRGIDRYDVGPSSLKTKLLRGAALEPRWSLIEILDLAPSPGGRERLVHWDAELALIGHRPITTEWWQQLGRAAESHLAPTAERDLASAA